VAIIWLPAQIKRADNLKNVKLSKNDTVSFKDNMEALKKSQLELVEKGLIPKICSHGITISIDTNTNFKSFYSILKIIGESGCFQFKQKVTIAANVVFTDLDMFKKGNSFLKVLPNRPIVSISEKLIRITLNNDTLFSGVLNSLKEETVCEIIKRSKALVDKNEAAEIQPEYSARSEINKNAIEFKCTSEVGLSKIDSMVIKMKCDPTVTIRFHFQ
jgi:hypothetical protein